MLLDFLLELYSDFSPMYFYISMVLSVLCTIQWMPYVTQHVYQNSRINIDSFHKGKVEQVTRNNAINEMNKTRHWLAIITKRIANPEDDDETASSLYFNRLKQIRGGKTCNINLYSLSLRKQVLSEFLA
ncbi:hypothetical protein [Paucisalibacillus sp. EB02]|uniref:hypothetical protein n=1 Tax=Paucisalibacillus sp. EB02 TaxID=1347087 RepID=UPI0005AA87BC|nr:hypothetical protein [Paucisalibacillus sp. EB02]